jgi:plasminogen activator inhibitor 1 RNA-binding protein
VPTAAVEGEEVKTDRPQRAERRGGRGKQYEGKAREDAHPMDRKDGTGKAHRGDKKGGHGKGNWGKDNEESKDIPEEERKERKPREKKEEEPKPEPVIEEEVGFTLDDYLQVKQSKAQGLYKTNQVREHQKIDAKNIKDLNYVHDEMATTKIYNAKDTIPTSSGANANLLGFQAANDAGDEFEARGSRGGRGGRGGDRPRQDRPQTQRGGRKNNRFVVDDNEFPAL